MDSDTIPSSGQHAHRSPGSHSAFSIIFPLLFLIRIAYNSSGRYFFLVSNLVPPGIRFEYSNLPREAHFELKKEGMDKNILSVSLSSYPIKFATLNISVPFNLAQLVPSLRGHANDIHRFT